MRGHQLINNDFQWNCETRIEIKVVFEKPSWEETQTLWMLTFETKPQWGVRLECYDPEIHRIFPYTLRRCELAKFSLLFTMRRQKLLPFTKSPLKHHQMASSHVSPTWHLEISSQVLSHTPGLWNLIKSSKVLQVLNLRPHKPLLATSSPLCCPWDHPTTAKKIRVSQALAWTVLQKAL